MTYILFALRAHGNPRTSIPDINVNVTTYPKAIRPMSSGKFLSPIMALRVGSPKERRKAI